MTGGPMLHGPMLHADPGTAELIANRDRIREDRDELHREVVRRLEQLGPEAEADRYRRYWRGFWTLALALVAGLFALALWLEAPAVAWPMTVGLAGATGAGFVFAWWRSPRRPL